MAKINLNDIVSGFNLSKINDNFQKIATALNDKVLWRNSVEGEPNQMQNDLDMNGKRVYNLPEPVADHEPARYKDFKEVKPLADQAKTEADRAKAEADKAKTEADRATQAAVFGGVNNLKIFNTLSEAQAAAATLPDGQVVDVEDEKKRYRVQGGALVFVANLDQLKQDLAATSGAGLVSTVDGRTVQQRLDALPSEVDAAGTAQTLVDAHIVSADPHPQLTVSINAAVLAAESARDAALIQAGVYVDEPTGRAAVADGQAFKVQGSGDVAAYEYRRTNSTTSELIATYPSAAAVRDTKPWLAADSLTLVSSTDLQIRDAIISVRAVNADPKRTYTLTLFCKDDPTLQDKIQINNDLSANWSFSGVIAGKADGPVTVTIYSGGLIMFVLRIDYRKISTSGTLRNSLDAKFKFSQKIFDVADIAINAASIPSLKSMPFWRAPASTDIAPTDSNSLSAQAAILDVRGVGLDRSKTYRIITLCKDHPTFNDNLQIGDGSTIYSNTSIISAEDKAAGPVWKSIPVGSGYIDVLIDYRTLSTGYLYSKAVDSTILMLDKIIHITSTAMERLNDIAKPWRDTSSTGSISAQYVQAILAVRCNGGNKAESYRFQSICKNHATFFDLVTISDQANANLWSTGNVTAPNKDAGPVWVKLTKSGSTTSFDILIDYRKITTNGIAFSAVSNAVKLSADIFQDEILYNAINAISAQSTNNTQTALARAIRVSLAGSSITWGNGWLGEDSYVGKVEDYLRNTLATTVHGAGFATTGTSSTVANKLFYKGAATLLSGVNSEASFSLTGNEISLCIARERGNVGAALVDLYVDNVLYDSFTTYNSEPYSTGNTFNFVGDGATLKFDLGKAFTFNHTLNIGGVSKVVQMNTQGYGGTMPAGVDGLIIRKMATVNGKPEVHHVLWLAVAPGNGVAIAGTYDAGESITYMKGTVGQSTRPLSGTNESTYGDGVVAFDPANPSSLSSGLGFRETDSRSVLTWKFNTSASRAVKVKITALDPRGTGTAQLYLNFATNRMHHLQNAGIGGWTAGLLLTDTGLNGLDDVVRFQPDVLLLESCTNDDWVTHINRAWVSRTGLTDAQVRGDESSNFFNAVTYVGPDNYSVDDVRVPITAITENSVTFSAANATFNVVAGDVVILGDFKGDNRRLACRVVSAWNASTRTATWAKPLRADEMAGIKALSDLVSTTARVKGSPVWVTNVETIIDNARSALPKTVIAVGTSGIPNIRYRRLEGYRELAQAICARKGCNFADFYGETKNWQYSQPPLSQKYLNASNSTTSTGASSYKLYNLGGGLPATNTLLRNWSVKVNGIERINDGCYVTGGSKKGWPAGVTQMSLLNTADTGDDYYLVFTSNVPASGDTIVVKHTSTTWSGDDTHPSPTGFGPFGQAVAAVMGNAARVAEAA